MVEPAVCTSSFIHINGTIVAALLLVVACCLLLVACCLLLVVVVVVVVVAVVVVKIHAHFPHGCGTHFTVHTYFYTLAQRVKGCTRVESKLHVLTSGFECW